MATRHVPGGLAASGAICFAGFVSIATAAPPTISQAELISGDLTAGWVTQNASTSGTTCGQYKLFWYDGSTLLNNPNGSLNLVLTPGTKTYTLKGDFYPYNPTTGNYASWLTLWLNGAMKPGPSQLLVDDNTRSGVAPSPTVSSGVFDGYTVAITNFSFTRNVASDEVSPCASTPGAFQDSRASVTIQVIAPNLAPTANAGPDQSIRAGATVNLNGGGSSDDNTATASLGYAWAFYAKPATSVATLSGASGATPSFVADKPGTYQVNLVVTDGGGLPSVVDQVVISSDNLAPTANAGDDQMVVLFSTVQLSGAGSTDPENDALGYAWSLTGPAGSTAVLNGAATATPNFQSDVPGAYTLTLNVSDFLGAGTPASVVVTAVSSAAYAEQKIMCGANLIAGLGPNQVTTKGNQTALGNFLSEAVKSIQKGQITTAIFKLNEAIARADGCEANPGPSPDGNGPGRDWVTDCGVQQPILACLRQARSALTP